MTKVVLTRLLFSDGIIAKKKKNCVEGKKYFKSRSKMLIRLRNFRITADTKFKSKKVKLSLCLTN
jgi:hypothetical protein